MADTTSDTDTVEAEEDIIKLMLNQHVARMQEIADEGLSYSKALLSQNTVSIKKLAGVKLTVLDQALKNLGLTPDPLEEPTVQLS